jgi:glycosyltransferase involved in cell wall biosynthesis
MSSPEQSRRRPDAVLLVTGAYHPEISAAAVQCGAAAAAFRDRIGVGVLTTAVTDGLAAVDRVDGVDVYRIPIDVRSARSRMLAVVRLVARMLALGFRYPVVHLHGFSQKNLPVTAIARFTGRKVVLSLHTSGQDEPAVVRRRGAPAWWAFTTPDIVLAVSPALQQQYLSARPDADVRLVPNGIDLTRFHPVDAARRSALRRELGLPSEATIVLFVGFFSPDKRPDLLYRAFMRAASGRHDDSCLVYVGATGPTYHEIDTSLARDLRTAADAAGAGDRVHFVPPTNDIERYFQTATIFALPSVREAHPLALIEAMACGLPCVASRLPGATDAIVRDGENGRLVPPDDEGAWAQALTALLDDPAAAARLGAQASADAAASFDIARTAERWLQAYDDVLA